MKKTIWKFELETTDDIKLSMPKAAQILSLQTQNGVPCIWAMVNPANEKEERTFRIYGTGHPIDAEKEQRFVGTYQLLGGQLVFHVFETL